MYRQRFVRPTAVIAASFLAISLVAWSGAAADVPPPSRVVSNYETATSNTLQRDCGYSAPLPPSAGNGLSLWLFCDTLQVDAAGNPTPPALPFWPGTFAAIGPSTPGQVPTQLSHIPSPPAPRGVLPSNRGPAWFLPNPTGLVDSGGSACTYAVTWATGLRRGPAASLTMRNGAVPIVLSDASNYLFVSFGHFCVIADATSSLGVRWEAKRAGIAAYDPVTNTFPAVSIVRSVASPTEVLDDSDLLWDPTFTSDHMYTYGVSCHLLLPAYGACGDATSHTARVSLDAVSEASAYEYWTASGWVTDRAQVQDTLEGSFLDTLILQVSDFTSLGKGYLAMEVVSMGGNYRLWQGATPAGPWTEVSTGWLSTCEAIPDGGCYQFIGHPELSTDGNTLYSVYDRVARVVEVLDVGAVPDLP